MNFNEPVSLGRTGYKVGRLGISSNYGTPADAMEEAFEGVAIILPMALFCHVERLKCKKQLKILLKKD